MGTFLKSFDNVRYRELTPDPSRPIMYRFRRDMLKEDFSSSRSENSLLCLFANYSVYVVSSTPRTAMALGHR